MTRKARSLSRIFLSREKLIERLPDEVPDHALSVRGWNEHRVDRFDGLVDLSCEGVAVEVGCRSAGSHDNRSRLDADHGDQAEGMQEMNGPALAGREEWYLRRQLQNFKSGARGTDSRDLYGLQMAPMAQLLQDEQAIIDVAAYLSSLK